MHQRVIKYLKIPNSYSYDCLHNVKSPHIATNTVLKEDYRIGHNFLSAKMMILCACVYMCACACVYMCVFACLYACAYVHIHKRTYIHTQVSSSVLEHVR